MSNKKRLLVTGGAGFIGRNIATQALGLGYDVTTLDKQDNTVSGVTFIRGDIRDKATVEKAMKGVDYVIHLAAVTANLQFDADLKGSYDINVNGFMNVMETARLNGVKKFVYASSSAVYTDHFSEDKIIDAINRGNHYAKSKIMNEMQASSYQDLYGLVTVGMRFFNVYGPGENEKGNYASIPMIFLKYKQKGEKIVIYGDGTQARDTIHVNDVAAIALKLLEKGTHRVYNIGTGVATPYNKIADLFHQEKVYVKNPVSPYQPRTKADLTRLKSVIGEYKFIPIGEGVRKLAEQYGVKL